MTYTDVNNVEAALSGFMSLEIDEKLALLASLYQQIAQAVPANAIDSLPTKSAAQLVTELQQLSKEDQLSALRTLLSAEKTDSDTTVLDPNPAKALTELVAGGETKVPVQEYTSLKPESRIAFWYLLAQRLGKNFIGLPSEYKPTQPATQVLNQLQSMNTDEVVAFLKQVV